MENDFRVTIEIQERKIGGFAASFSIPNSDKTQTVGFSSRDDLDQVFDALRDCIKNIHAKDSLNKENAIN